VSGQLNNDISFSVAKCVRHSGSAAELALLVANATNAWLRVAYSPAFWCILASSRLFHSDDWKYSWANRQKIRAIVADEVTTLCTRLRYCCLKLFGYMYT
jgi:hypothetical protein